MEEDAGLAARVRGWAMGSIRAQKGDHQRTWRLDREDRLDTSNRQHHYTAPGSGPGSACGLSQRHRGRGEVRVGGGASAIWHRSNVGGDKHQTGREHDEADDAENDEMGSGRPEEDEWYENDRSLEDSLACPQEATLCPHICVTLPIFPETRGDDGNRGDDLYYCNRRAGLRGRCLCGAGVARSRKTSTEQKRGGKEREQDC